MFPLFYNTLAVLNHDVTGTCPPLFGRTDGSLPSLLPVSLAIARGEFSATLREEVKNIVQVSSVKGCVQSVVNLLEPFKHHCNGTGCCTTAYVFQFNGGCLVRILT